MALTQCRHRMLADGVTPNTKTFTALIGSVGRQAPLQQALDLVGELLASDSPQGKLPTYTALMAACEKGGLWELALALFQRMTDEVSLILRSDRSQAGVMSQCVRLEWGQRGLAAIHFACLVTVVLMLSSKAAGHPYAKVCPEACMGRWAALQHSLIPVLDRQPQVQTTAPHAQ